MPSPFPGMDPFLETPAFFSGLHIGLMFCLREALQLVLPEPYYAEMADRTWVEVSQRDIEPDVNVLRGEKSSTDAAGGVAVAQTTATPPCIIRVPHTSFREVYLDVFARLDEREQVVASIEILSRSNKTPGEKGRDLYLQKQREILNGKVHLVEIDLLRAGQHSTAVPLNYLRAAVPAYNYHVCIKHFDNVEDYFVYPIALQERLPVIEIPLLPGDRAAVVDLQAALDRAYDTGPYRRRVRYTDPVPAAALAADKTTWVEQVLRDKGLRPGP